MKHGTGYGPVLLIAGTLHVLAFLLILATIREVRPMEIAASGGKYGSSARPICTGAPGPPEDWARLREAELYSLVLR
jgi:hypothetical protein